MKKFVMVFLALMVLAVGSYASAAAGTIAVVPYLNTAEENKDYVPETINAGYTNHFAKAGLSVIPAANVESALTAAGYEESNQMLPDKDMMADVAAQVGADYVVAMEVVSINATRHISMFSTKIRTSTKLKYHFYNAATGRMTAFQTSAENNNKAVLIGDVGSKQGIVATLNDCMDQANTKISGFLAAR